MSASSTDWPRVKTTIRIGMESKTTNRTRPAQVNPVVRTVMRHGNG